MEGGSGDLQKTWELGENLGELGVRSRNQEQEVRD